MYIDIQTETFNDVKINPELTEQQKLEVMELLEEFQYVFTDVPGLTTLGEHSINLTSMDPVHSKPYPIPHAMQEVVEKECLAIVWAVQKLQNFLYGKQLILETDHQPLQYLGKAQFRNGRLMRWALTLQPYRFVIRAIKGGENVGADFLSRHTTDSDD